MISGVNRTLSECRPGRLIKILVQKDKIKIMWSIKYVFQKPNYLSI